MSSYDARLGLPEQLQLPLPVTVVTASGNIALYVGETLIAEWPLERVSITREKRGFRLVADGEDLIVDITEPNRFALEVGITDSAPAETPPRGRWHRRRTQPAR